MRIRMSASPLLGGAAVAIGPTPAPAPYDPLRFELSPPPPAAAAKDLAPNPAATSLCPRPPPAGSPAATSTNRRGTSWPSSTSRIPRLPTGLKLIQVSDGGHGTPAARVRIYTREYAAPPPSANGPVDCSDAQFNVQELFRKLGNEEFMGQRIILAVTCQ
ncbi:hypothetical protein ZWY2020_022474 [Hordeum vulgare]|nr:hypothetical protein ZWY2020_022474 [Hordeum vulgare]